MRPRSRIALALVLLVVIAALVFVFMSIRQAGDPGRLDVGQWRRLSERFAQRWYRLQPTPRTTPAPPGPAGAVVPTPTPVWRWSTPIPDPETLARQATEYSATRRKTVIELQPLRHTQRSAAQDGHGRTGTATLINLNPAINEWYVLQLQWADGDTEQYHLANARPSAQSLELDAQYPGGLVVTGSSGRTPCELWSGADTLADRSRRVRSPYVLLCNERVVLRLPTAGNKTALEWSTDFLRDNIWGGEKITVLVRETLFQDAFVAIPEPDEGQIAAESSEPTTTLPGGPRPLQVDPAMAGSVLEPVDLGLRVDAEEPGRLVVGSWYPVRGCPGVWVSVIQPELVAPEILAGYRAIAGTLDEVERKAQVMLVAFDLARFELGFTVGTDHPRVGWSERVRDEMRDETLPGPDGIGEIAPLVATGIIPPAVADRVAATFTGGFKRAHGAFKSSQLALQNHGSHYGFVESGVVLSTLQPGLATLLVSSDGRVEMGTWTADSAPIASIRHARQNGVALVEPDPETGRPRPGALVARWGRGNWSGSQDSRFRTLRAGACLQETEQGRFLVYGYFSSATPSAMARVFQACDCRYAMQLDINALEHTYLAVYRVQEGKLVVEHLVKGMEVLDKQVSGQVLPRFLGFADNRDFFYLMRRSNGAAESPVANGAPGNGTEKG